MKILRNLLCTMMFLPAIALAAFPCPPDSCNPHNGCIDGCNGGVDPQKCSERSDVTCQGKDMYSSCVWTYETDEGEVSRPGFCHPTGVVQTQIKCGCR